MYSIPVLRVLHIPELFISSIFGPCSTTRTGNTTLIGSFLQLLYGITFGSSYPHTYPPTIVISSDGLIFWRPIKSSIVNNKFKIRSVTRYSTSGQRSNSTEVRINLFTVLSNQSNLCRNNLQMNNLLVNSIAIPVISGDIVYILVVCSSCFEISFVNKTPNTNTILCIFICVKRIGITPTSCGFVLVGCIVCKPGRCNNRITNPPTILSSANFSVSSNPI